MLKKNPIITFSDVLFHYEGTPLLDNLSFSITKNEIVTLIGPSGSGKTTILNLLNGLEKPISGTILVNDTPPPESASHLTYMMQDDLLLPWRSVNNNISLTSELGSKNLCVNEVNRQRSKLMAELELTGSENKLPHELSGGMRQRVALGRALLQNRPILLLDEPFASLDVTLREQIYLLLRNIRNKLNSTILLVTHDFHDALALSDRILLLKNGAIQNEWVIDNKMRSCPNGYGIIIHNLRESLK